MPPPSRVIIFLDIDGVLLPFGCTGNQGRLFPEATLQALAYILARVPEAQLVLSSTWRVQETFIQSIVQDFRAFGGALSDVDFHDITNPALHSERQHEIYDYLARHGHEVLAWVALDDEELVRGPVNAKHSRIFEYHCVRTDSHEGMTMEDAQHAVLILRNQLGR